MAGRRPGIGYAATLTVVNCGCKRSSGTGRPRASSPRCAARWPYARAPDSESWWPYQEACEADGRASVALTMVWKDSTQRSHIPALVPTGPVKRSFTWCRSPPQKWQGLEAVLRVERRVPPGRELRTRYAVVLLRGRRARSQTPLQPSGSCSLPGVATPCALPTVASLRLQARNSDSYTSDAGNDQSTAHAARSAWRALTRTWTSASCSGEQTMLMVIVDCLVRAIRSPVGRGRRLAAQGTSQCSPAAGSGGQLLQTFQVVQSFLSDCRHPL